MKTKVKRISNFPHTFRSSACPIFSRLCVFFALKKNRVFALTLTKQEIQLGLFLLAHVCIIMYYDVHANCARTNEISRISYIFSRCVFFFFFFSLSVSLPLSVCLMNYSSVYVERQRKKRKERKA